MQETPTQNLRLTSARLIDAWLTQGSIPPLPATLTGRDRGIVMEIVHGAVRRLRPLAWLSEQLCRRKPEHRVKALLYTGLYELFFMTRPDHAAVNETVAAARIWLDKGRGGFINAVLRRATRERTALLDGLSKTAAGIYYSHPDDLAERWTERFGAEPAHQIMAWNNTPPKTYGRLLTSQIDMTAFMEQCRQQHITDLQPHPPDAERFFQIPPGVRPDTLPGFAAGQFLVQDPATRLATDLADIQPGIKIWDACAAPGGKAVCLAEAAGPEGYVLATDRSDDRLPRLHENIKRMKLSQVAIRQLDAATDVPPEAPFDVVLLDVPCTNTGVLARRPEARWRFSEKNLRNLVKQQEALLDRAATAVAPGGALVYSTCSIEPDENDRLIADWLQTHPAYTLEQQAEVLPGAEGTDGAFAVRLRRQADD